MSLPLFDARMSYTDRVIDLMTGQPGELFDGLSLGKVAGAYAWRTRVSEARRRLRAAGKGDILNIQKRLPDGRCQSLYTYQPFAEVR